MACVKRTCVLGSAAEPVATGTRWTQRGSAQVLPGAGRAERSSPRSFPRRCPPQKGVHIPWERSQPTSTQLSGAGGSLRLSLPRPCAAAERCRAASLRQPPAKPDSPAETTQRRVGHVWSFGCFSGLWHCQGRPSQAGRAPGAGSGLAARRLRLCPGPNPPSSSPK